MIQSLQGYRSGFAGVAERVARGEFSDTASANLTVSLTNFAYSTTANDFAQLVGGGDGNDTLNALGGNDVVYGGAGNDTYRFNLGDGVDRIDEVLRVAEAPPGGPDDDRD